MGKREQPDVATAPAPVRKDALKAFLKEAQSWETSEVLRLRKSVKVGWSMAGVGLLCGMLGMASSAFQASKEAPMPVVLRWNEITGTVQRLDSLKEGKITPGEATDKYFAQLYVQYRESWNKELAKENYYRVGLMSTHDEQQRWEALYRSDQSPAKVYGDNARVRAVIKGSSILKPGVISVRYLQIVERANTAGQEASEHTATVTFAYSSGRMSEYDRGINPLGFQASYRSDPDTPGVPPQLVPQPGARPAPPAPAALAASPAVPAARLDLRPLQERGQ